MPNYPSNFISGAAPGVQSKDNISDRWELRLDRTVSVASVSQFTVTAATTATVSVAATLTASAIFKRLVSLMKPIIRKILTKKQPNAEN